MTEIAGVSKRIVKNVGLMFSGYALNLLGSLFVLVYLARHLSQEDFGIFNFALAFIGLFSVLLDICTQQIIIREVSTTISRADVIIGNGVILKFLSGILGFILINLSAVLIRYDVRILLIVCLLAGGMLFAPRLQTFREAFEAIFHARLEMAVPLILRIVDGAAVPLFVVMAMSFGGSLSAVSVAYVLSGVPGLVFIVIAALKYVRPKLRLEKAASLWLLKESLPVMVYQLFGGFYARIDITLIQYLRGSVEVASYAAVNRLAEPLNIIPMAFSSATFPLISRYIAERKTVSRNKVVTVTIKALLVIGSCGAIATFLIGDDILTLLYDSKYQSSLVPFQILMASKLFQFFNFFSVSLMISAGKQRSVTFVMFIMVCLNILLNYMTIPAWGIVGTSSARFVSDIVGFMLFYLLIRRFLNLSLLGITAKILVITLFAIGISYGTMMYAHKIIAVLVVVGFYIVAVFLSQFFSKDELVIMRSLVRRSP